MKCPELLAPAGTRENLEIAIRYGADAVYQGLAGFSLRRATKAEMSLDTIREAIEWVHDHQKRYYLAINILAHEKDLNELERLLPELALLKVDALIVADPGIIRLIRAYGWQVPIHLSTQGSVVNREGVKFWSDQGVERVILGRELRAEELVSIRKACPTVELEVFVHGAMCMAYSGRCHLSHYLLDRDSNRGQCAQVCRWKFDIEKENSVTAIDVEEDERGTYLLNAKDLCLAPVLSALMNLDCLKIEGRNKTSYYIGNVVRVYRWILDLLFLKGDGQPIPNQWLEELSKVSHRPYSLGFFDDRNDLFAMETPGYIKDYSMVGIVSSVEGNELVIHVRDTLKWGDSIELLGVNPESDRVLVLNKMMLEGSEDEMKIAHPNQKIKIALVEPLLKEWQGALVRKRLT